MSQMHVTYPHGGQTAELGRYLRLEYGANAAYARSMVGRGPRAGFVRIRRAPHGAIRRFLAAVLGALGTARASPEGA